MPTLAAPSRALVAPAPRLLALALALLRLARSAARPLRLRPHVRRLELERLAAVELDRVAPGRGVFAVHRVEVGGDAALAVHVRPARTVDLHPLVHEGLCV